MLLVCDRQLSALNMSNRTKQVNVMVVSRFVLPADPSAISRWKTHNVPKMIMLADSRTFTISARVIMGCLTFRGLCFSTSWSTGSTPNDWAGGPSIMMLIHSICMALSGLAMPISVASAISDKAAMDVLNWNRTKLRML